MYTVRHVYKYKITFKLVINWTNEILQHIVVSSGVSRPGIIDARARYRAAARRLRDTVLKICLHSSSPNSSSFSSASTCLLCSPRVYNWTSCLKPFQL